MHQLANELVDAFAGDGKADLVEQFTEPFILRSVCTLVGLPEGDHEHVAAADMLTELTGLVTTLKSRLTRPTR